MNGWESLPTYQGDPPIQETAPTIICPKCSTRLRVIELKFECRCGWSRAFKPKKETAQ